MAYNMGPSRAHRWLSQYPATDYGYVKKVMYVYGVLVEAQKADKRVADSIQNKMKEEARLSLAPRPLLMKPRTLSMAAFPMTLPSGRKSELEQEK